MLVALLGCGGAERAEPETTPAPAEDATPAPAAAPAPAPAAEQGPPPADLLTLVPEGPTAIALAHLDRLAAANLLDAAAPWLRHLGIPASPALTRVLARALVTPSAGDEEPALVILEHRIPQPAPTRSADLRPEWGTSFEVGSRVIVSAQATIAEAARAQARAGQVANDAARRLETFRSQQQAQQVAVELATSGGGGPAWPAGLRGLGAGTTTRLDAILVLGAPAVLIVHADYASPAQTRRAEEALAQESAPSAIGIERRRTGHALELTATGPAEPLLAWLASAAR